MIRRPAVILWEMLGIELIRQVVLSTIVLVLVITFAATLRPVAEGQIGAGDALRYMLYASVPMLQFALPFAAAFAATLTYHRFGSDNESQAASAGGIGYSSLLAPTLVLGVVLAVVLMTLSNVVIPQFTRSMRELVVKDLARTLVASLERGESVDMQGLIISADKTTPVPESERGPFITDRFILEGVIAVDVNETSGSLDADVTASLADILFYPGERDANGDAVTLVSMELHNAVARQPGEGLAQNKSLQIGPWPLPTALSDDPDFYSSSGLRTLYASPDAIPAVDRTRRVLASSTSEYLAMRRAQDDADAMGSLGFTDELGQQFSFATRGLRSNANGRMEVLSEQAGSPLEITRKLDSGAVRIQHAERGWLRMDVDIARGETTAQFELENVVTPGAQQGTRVRLVYDKLRLSSDPAPALFTLPAIELREEVESVISSAPLADAQRVQGLRDADASLAQRIDSTRREIVGVRHERLALPAACLLMTVLGGVMGLRLHESLPLSVYLWSFFPALFAVITISGGSNVAKDTAGLGVALTWLGVLALVAITGVQYARLRRH
ncbi:MAG: LptF/LptG family permease [Phycisphaerales bacterium JB043]